MQDRFSLRSPLSLCVPIPFPYPFLPYPFLPYPFLPYRFVLIGSSLSVLPHPFFRIRFSRIGSPLSVSCASVLSPRTHSLPELSEDHGIARGLPNGNLGGAVERGAARNQVVNAVERLLGRIDVIDFNEEDGTRHRSRRDGGDVGRDAVMRLVHDFQAVLLQNDEAKPVAVRDFGGLPEIESIHPEGQARFDFFYVQDGRDLGYLHGVLAGSG